MNKLTLAGFAFLLLLPLSSCEPESGTENDSKVYAIDGYAQKGPFVVGSAVTISELDNDLIPTGRVYFSTVLNAEGYFELPGVMLSSPFIQIKVEGKYFGEASGAITDDELILYSIADVRESQSINVNIITHLIKRRIEKLVQDSNESFADAKDQAFEELLETFHWNDADINDADQLNITDDNAGGSTLLTVSILFDNITNPIARLEAMTDFQTDLGDGSIDDASTQSLLVSSAESINPEAIQSNLTFYFGSGNFPDFTGPLNQFIENTEFVNYLDLIYPASFNGKENLIWRTDSALNASDTYYISITIPAGQQSDVIFNMVARTDSSINRFYTPEHPAQFWDQMYAQEYVQCTDNPGDNSCFETYVMLHRVNLSQNLNFQIPVTFSGSGTLTVYYSAHVNGTFSYGERKFTW